LCGLFTSLVDWAKDKLNDFVTWVTTVANKLSGYLNTILDFLDESPFGTCCASSICWQASLEQGSACIRDPSLIFSACKSLDASPSSSDCRESLGSNQRRSQVIIKTVFVNFDSIEP
jgi:hypothetical protein